MPSLWDSGVQWSPAEDPDAEGFWSPTLDLDLLPSIAISIASAFVPNLQSASWTLGRQNWFDVLSPNSASFSFVGQVDAIPNDAVLVSTDSGPLWQGRVDNITTATNTDGTQWTTVTATDPVGKLAMTSSSRLFTWSPSNTLEHLATYVAATVGVTLNTEVADSATALPYLDGTYQPGTATLLDVLNDIERSSNAMMMLQSDGVYLIATRDATVAASVTTIDLSGDDAPSSWTTSLDPTNAINHWTFTAQDSTVILDTPASSGTGHLADAVLSASITAYGERAYAISPYLAADYAAFPLAMRDALATPRTVVTNATFPITTLRQDILLLQPFSWVSFGGDTWQVMSVSHAVDVSGSWTVTITADVSQNFFTSSDPPTPDPPPSDYSVDTQTITADKDTAVEKTSAGVYAGNGQGGVLPVGYFDGDRFRSMIHFAISWPAGFVSVKKATLTLRTTGQVRVSFGPYPKFQVRRITDSSASWPEGTVGGDTTFTTANATVWPGPDTTTSGQRVISFGNATNTDHDIDITDIAQGWHDNGNGGLKLISNGEDAHTNTIEFYSIDHGSHKPTLTLHCYTSP